MSESSIIMLGIINLIVGLFLWFYFLRTYFIDSHKYELLVLRNKLFDYTFENKISFDHPAVKDRLNEIDSMMKFSNSLIPLLLTGSVLFRRFRREQELYSKTKDQNINNLHEEHRKFFRDSSREQGLLFLSYIIKSSIILIILSTIFIVALFIITFLIFFSNRTKIEGEVKRFGRPFMNALTYTSLKTI